MLHLQCHLYSTTRYSHEAHSSPMDLSSSIAFSASPQLEPFSRCLAIVLPPDPEILADKVGSP